MKTISILMGVITMALAGCQHSPTAPAPSASPSPTPKPSPVGTPGTN